MAASSVVTVPDEEIACPSFIKMAGRGEGNYASSISADVRSQMVDHGLTLSLKIHPENEWHLDDAGLISEEALDDALKHFQRIERQIDRQQSWSPKGSIYGDDLSRGRPAKRRRILANDPPEPANQRVGLGSVSQNRSVSTLHVNMA
jgi:hypothetical protein